MPQACYSTRYAAARAFILRSTRLNTNKFVHPPHVSRTVTHAAANPRAPAAPLAVALRRHHSTDCPASHARALHIPLKITGCQFQQPNATHASLLAHACRCVPACLNRDSSALATPAKLTAQTPYLRQSCPVAAVRQPADVPVTPPQLRPPLIQAVRCIFFPPGTK